MKKKRAPVFSNQDRWRHGKERMDTCRLIRPRKDYAPLVPRFGLDRPTREGNLGSPSSFVNAQDVLRHGDDSMLRGKSCSRVLDSRGQVETHKGTLS